MSDERMIRHENLLLLLKMRNWVSADLKKALGCSYTHAGRLVRNATTFGEKAARDYEEKLGLPRGWFDVVHLEGEYTPESIKESVANHIEKYFDLAEPAPPAHGIVRTGEPQPPFFTGMRPADTSERFAPVVGWDRIGEALQLLEKCAIVSDKFLAIPASASPRSFWVIVDEPMPRFGLRKGYKIALHPLGPKEALTDGEVYLFRAKTGAFFLGELRSLADGGYEALPEGGPPLDSSRHGIVAVALHTGTWKQ